MRTQYWQIAVERHWDRNR